MQNYHTRLATQDDRDVIVRLLCNNLYNGDKAKGRVNWVMSGPIGGRIYLVSTEDGQDIGTVSIILKEFYVCGNVRVGGKLTDMCVDEGFRTLKPALTLLTAAVKDALQFCDFLYATPSTNSYPIFKRKFKKFADYEKYVKILKVNTFIRKKIKHTTLTWLISPILNGILSLSRLPEKIKRRKFDTLNYYTQDREVLVSTYMESSDTHAIVAVKNKKYVDWRYGNDPLLKTYTWSTVILKRTYTIIYTVNDENRVIILDIIFKMGDTGTVEKILYLFEAFCVYNSFESISVEIVGCPEIQNILKIRGYKARVNGHDIWLNKEANLNTDESLWLAGDGDFIV